ncbi:MAG: hypothetical protein M8357_09725 [Desulfobulbaceae bacterium]|nr:hypothetical protein [Desulfobulbaceae bacterium]
MIDRNTPADTDQIHQNEEKSIYHNVKVEFGNKKAKRMDLFEELIPLISYMHQQENVLREQMRRMQLTEKDQGEYLPADNVNHQDDFTAHSAPTSRHIVR